MMFRVIAASLLIACLGFTSAEAMPLAPLPKLAGGAIEVDYTCGDGMHFTFSDGCVVDEKKPTAQAPSRKPSRKVRASTVKRHHARETARNPGALAG